MRTKTKLRCLWLTLPVILIDQLTKLLAQARLAAVESFDVIPGVLVFRYCENRGVAFSMLSGSQALTIALTAALVAALAVWIVCDRQLTAPVRIALSLTLGGGISNLIDRVARGFVIDMIDPVFVRFAVFNVADIFICVGAITAALFLMFGGKEEKDHGRK